MTSRAHRNLRFGIQVYFAGVRGLEILDRPRPRPKRGGPGPKTALGIYKGILKYILQLSYIDIQGWIFYTYFWGKITDPRQTTTRQDRS